MNSNELAFHNLTKLIEDTEKLLFKQLPNTQTLEELTNVTNQYFKLYEYKSDIIKGITSTVPYKELLEDRYKWLKSLSQQCDGLYKSSDIPTVIDSEDNFLFFAKSSIVHNRINPLLIYVIHEIKICLNISNRTILIDEDKIITNKNSYSPIMENKPLEWKGTELQFAELAKALKECGQ